MQPLRDAGIALSLANLCFFRVWSAYFYGFHRPYFRKDAFLGGDYLAIILDVVLLGALFWGAAALARRGKRRWTRTGMQVSFFLVFLAVVYIIAKGLTRQAVQPNPEPTPLSVGTLLFAVLGGLVAFYGLWRWWAHVVRICAFLVLIVSPFVLVTFFQAAWMILKERPEQARLDKPSAPRLPSPENSAPRVLWLVFDGMDQRLAFPDRPSSLQLPELDRLRDQALFARKAYPLSNSTIVALPAFLSGKYVNYAEPSGPDELLISFHEAAQIGPWSQQPNIFSRAREAGVNSGLVGWFHPYCRVIGSSLASCSWVPYQSAGEPRNFLERMRDEMSLLLWSLPFASYFFAADPLGLDLLPTRTYRENHIRKYLFVREAAQRMAGDPSLGLVFVHWPVPHAPPLYDRHKEDFSSGAHGKEWYLDSLALVDRTLGELRSVVEQAQLWDRTTILLTSDHSWQGSVSLDGKTSPQVPFLLKLPGQTESIIYDSRFNTVVSHDLVLAILRGELTQPEQAAHWLDLHRQPIPSDPSAPGHVR